MLSFSFFNLEKHRIMYTTGKIGKRGNRSSLPMIVCRSKQRFKWSGTFMRRQCKHSSYVQWCATQKEHYCVCSGSRRVVFSATTALQCVSPFWDKQPLICPCGVISEPFCCRAHWNRSGTEDHRDLSWVQPGLLLVKTIFYGSFLYSC